MLRRCGWNEKKCKQFTLYEKEGNVDKSVDPALFFILMKLKYENIFI